MSGIRKPEDQTNADNYVVQLDINAELGSVENDALIQQMKQFLSSKGFTPHEDILSIKSGKHSNLEHIEIEFEVPRGVTIDLEEIREKASEYSNFTSFVDIPNNNFAFPFMHKPLDFNQDSSLSLSLQQQITNSIPPLSPEMINMMQQICGIETNRRAAASYINNFLEALNNFKDSNLEKAYEKLSTTYMSIPTSEKAYSMAIDSLSNLQQESAIELARRREQIELKQVSFVEFALLLIHNHLKENKVDIAGERYTAGWFADTMVLFANYKMEDTYLMKLKYDDLQQKMKSLQNYNQIFSQNELMFTLAYMFCAAFASSIIAYPHLAVAFFAIAGVALSTQYACWKHSAEFCADIAMTFEPLETSFSKLLESRDAEDFKVDLASIVTKKIVQNTTPAEKQRRDVLDEVKKRKQNESKQKKSNSKNYFGQFFKNIVSNIKSVINFLYELLPKNKVKLASDKLKEGNERLRAFTKHKQKAKTGNKSRKQKQETNKTENKKKKRKI